MPKDPKRLVKREEVRYQTPSTKTVFFFFLLGQALVVACSIFDPHFSMRDLQLQQVGSSSLTRDQTQASSTGSVEP